MIWFGIWHTDLELKTSTRFGATSWRGVLSAFIFSEGLTFLDPLLLNCVRRIEQVPDNALFEVVGLGGAKELSDVCKKEGGGGASAKAVCLAVRELAGRSAHGGSLPFFRSQPSALRHRRLGCLGVAARGAGRQVLRGFTAASCPLRQGSRGGGTYPHCGPEAETIVRRAHCDGALADTFDVSIVST